MTGSGMMVSMTMSLDGKKTRQGWREVAVEPEYFETIGAELVAGRFFTSEDAGGRHASPSCPRATQPETSTERRHSAPRPRAKSAHRKPSVGASR